MRFSKQRQIVLDTLLESQEHLTADEIFKKAQEKDTLISIATVYRNLNQLFEKGLIKKVNGLGSINLYDGNIKPHDHLHCTSCGEIYDIPREEVPDIKEQVALNTGHLIENAEIIFTGICNRCQEEEK